MSRWILLVSLLLVAGLTHADPVQKGYFKDGAGNRIFSVVYSGELSSRDALQFGRSKPNRSGQMTAVYFYRAGAVVPADGLTRARNVIAANRVLYDVPGLSAWQYAYMRFYNGSDQLVDCQASPGSDFCRQ